MTLALLWYLIGNYASLSAQSAEPLAPPPAVLLPAAADTVATMVLPHNNTFPQTAEQLMARDLTWDLRTPSNITRNIEYDIESGNYIIGTKLGDRYVGIPVVLTPQEFNQWQMRQTLNRYFHNRNSEFFSGPAKEPFNVLDMNFAIGPLEKIFGPGGVSLRTSGTVNVTMGIKSNFTDNPALSLTSRRKTYFDFDQKIQASVRASVGDRLNFNLNYNTNATFDFDTKNLKLAYEGKEDDIVKSIEAGNVQMTTGSSLIQGATALFGVKSTLQFGRLTATALVSQQNSQSRSVNTKGGVQTTPFTISSDQYQENAHYYLAQFFRDNYDRFCARLPYVSSGIQITRIEVWITNKSGNYNQSRNVVAFQDLAESTLINTDCWTPNTFYPNPSNNSNNLLERIQTEYPGARDINTVTQTLAPLSAYGIYGGSDYEKVESARLLSSSEYRLNASLGYISLNAPLRSDEVLAVAYQYTYNGQVYQVGEFSADVTTTDNALFVKMLKSSNVNPRQPMWRLMMKNVYSLPATEIQREGFRLDIKYLSDTTGTEIPYLPVPGISDKPLLQVMNLDRLDSNQEGNPDGFFDYLEGYTINSSRGYVIFPVAEPFGQNLLDKIGNYDLAEPYLYTQLYDSTRVVAQQYADRNKFVLTGQYKGAAGSEISLGATNVPRGSVIVTAGGVTLTEGSDYTVNYSLGTVTITNPAIIESGQNVSVRLEDQSLFSMQRKSLIGLDLNYKFHRNLSLGATLLHYSEKALIEKVRIGEEVVNNTMLGLNLNYSTDLNFLTNLLNKIPTVNAVAPSKFSIRAEIARLIPTNHQQGSNRGSSYIDDFENSQNGLDLRAPYAWVLASTPYEDSPAALFPEAALSNNVAYGKNRALLNWYYIDRLFTQRNSSLAPGYIKADLAQLSNPYVREVTTHEIFPYRQLTYGESSTIQTLNLSFYPNERGPYNLDAENIDDQGNLLFPEQRWGGIMRRIEQSNFEQNNYEYIQFWMMSPFLDPDNPNTSGGDLYINLGDISEDILKDGLKSYENGIPVDGNDTFLTSTVWGHVSRQNSLTYAFDNANSARKIQDTGLDGLLNEYEYGFDSYAEYIERLRRKLPESTIQTMQEDPASPFNDPAGDNYHFYRGRDYDERRLSILERYKRYNGVEGNSLSPTDVDDPLYQPARAQPDVEDINQDNTLNEYERYFQYRISIRPEDMEVGRNYITDKQVSMVPTRDGKDQEVVWYQFKIPVRNYQKIVGSINDFTSIRFIRMFMTGFRHTTHLRFATFELVRGEWRTYQFNLNNRADTPAEGSLDVSVVNIEENAGREPVNYLLPPGVTRISDPSQAQIVQENEQSLELTVEDLAAGDARAIYTNTSYDLRNYRRLQMWIHAEALINNATNLKSGELSLFVRLGSDVKQNFYEYEIPLTLTPPAHYDDNSEGRYMVWPEANFMDLPLQALVDLKVERNRQRLIDPENVGYNTLFTGRDPANQSRRMAVTGNPSLSDIRVMLIGVRNNSSTVKAGTVWVNELKVTDFESQGGWGAKAQATLALSDVATLNAGAHIETSGFGGVDQSLNSRRMDNYSQYNIAVQGDLGRFVPAGAKMRAPIYYSYTNEKISPKYNPLDQDVLLKDALDAVETAAQRDSIRAFAEDRTSVQNFSISGLTFDVRSHNPMPWDPANLSGSFSFSRTNKINPTTEYENTNDYRGNLQYSYSPLITPLKPLGFIKSDSRQLKFLKDYEVNWLPGNISLGTSMSRYYYEQQVRSETDRFFELPVSVSKNFLWDRQLRLTWNLTKSINLSFASNTSARIDEPVGAVNRRLFPDRYREWRDTIWQSILRLGTPWGYNQNFSATYTAPFNQIPALDYLSGSLNYNATYRWDRGATVDGISMGNTVAGQSSATVSGRLNFDNIYNKVPYLKKVNSRFSSARRNVAARSRKPKQYERTIQMRNDTTVRVKHNLRTKRLRISAEDAKTGEEVKLQTRIVDMNSIEVLNREDRNVKITITERPGRDANTWDEVAQYATRLLMSPKGVNMNWKYTRSLSLPLFGPDAGNLFGQSLSHGPMAPGAGFAFGFFDENYVSTAKERGWLLTDDGQTSPSSYSRSHELSLELSLEPIPGLKITLTNSRVDNRSESTQFMYADMPTSLTGTFTKTHIAIGTALRGSSDKDGYANAAFNRFLSNIPVIADRIESAYSGITYPDGGFMTDNTLAGMPYDPQVGSVSRTGSDVLIPAFMSAYSNRNPKTQYLTPFPGFGASLPNWRVSYDGLINLFNLKDVIKSVNITHAYQCVYTVAGYTSYLNYVSAPATGLSGMGFVRDELTGNPFPSSPYNIASVAITESFAPLAGAEVTLKNNMSLSAQWRESRTLTLNTSAGQVVEATQRGITIGVGYKILNFNTILKLKGVQSGVSHDLDIKGDFSFNLNQALIRRIETAYTQPTSGAKTLNMQLTANYQMSRRLKIGAYLEHQMNTPVVSSTSFPTSSTAFGLRFDLSLSR